MPQVLLLADYRNWAWDIKSRNLQTHFSKWGIKADILYKYDYVKDVITGWHDIRYEPNRTIDFSDYDATILFSKVLADVINPSLDYDKAFIGVCSHVEYSGSLDNQRDVEFFNRFRGVFVLNKVLFKEFKPVIHNLFYCPNGVDTSHFQPINTVGRQKRLVVGWAGSPSHLCQKGFYKFISPLETHGFTLRVAKKDAAKINHKDMNDFYNSLDVYVCMSETEGTPNPCLEAAACGRPIVTTKVGNMPELIQHNENGLFVERTMQSLTSALNILDKNRRMLRTMSLRIRQDILSWDWQLQTENFIYMLREVL